MAINVNTVYQTVLLILNKEQRGYITPDEFNITVYATSGGERCSIFDIKANN